MRGGAGLSSGAVVLIAPRLAVHVLHAAPRIVDGRVETDRLELQDLPVEPARVAGVGAGLEAQPVIPGSVVAAISELLRGRGLVARILRVPRSARALHIEPKRARVDVGV